MQITERIFRITRIKGANVYLYISKNEEVSLIDTGMSGNAKQILDEMSRININPEQLSYIILTHADMDHVGSVPALKKLTGAKTVLHAKDRPYFMGIKKRKFSGFIGCLFELINTLMSVRQDEPDLIVDGGECIGGLMVIHTPGHTEGSISLYSEDEVLFSGDILLTTPAGKISGSFPIFTNDSREANKSIGTLACLSFPLMLPGHGQPLLDRASEKVREFAAEVMHL